MTTSNELSCQELVELVTEYLEGTLPTHERVRFENHLAICPSCGNYLDQMRRTIQMVGALKEEAIPDEAKEQLLHAFRLWKQAT
jgi:predicted anti-sigma-YlaC factor YlaD